MELQSLTRFLGYIITAKCTNSFHVTVHVLFDGKLFLIYWIVSYLALTLNLTD